MAVTIILHDVNNVERELGPFSQVVFETEIIGGAIRVSARNVNTSEPICWAYGGFWFYDDHPYKQLFVREAIQE